MRCYDECLKSDIISFIDKYYLKNNKSPSIREIADGVNRAKSTVYDYISKMANEGRVIKSDKDGICTAVTEKTNTDMISVALVGEIACGTPILAEENITEYYQLPVSFLGKGNFYMLTAKGDSMINAGINDGDKVVIRQQNTAEEGQIVVALINDEATLKRFYIDKENKRIRLHPENKEYPDIYVDNLQIQGVAVKALKDLM